MFSLAHVADAREFRVYMAVLLVMMVLQCVGHDE